MLELLSGSELIEACAKEKQTIGQIMLARETELQGKSKQSLMEEMQQQLTTMRLAVKRGLDHPQKSLGGLIGGEATVFRGANAFFFREKHAAGGGHGDGNGGSERLHGPHRSSTHGRGQRDFARCAAGGAANAWL